MTQRDKIFLSNTSSLTNYYVYLNGSFSSNDNPLPKNNDETYYKDRVFLSYKKGIGITQSNLFNNFKFIDKKILLQKYNTYYDLPSYNININCISNNYLFDSKIEADGSMNLLCINISNFNSNPYPGGSEDPRDISTNYSFESFNLPGAGNNMHVYDINNLNSYFKNKDLVKISSAELQIRANLIMDFSANIVSNIFSNGLGHVCICYSNYMANTLVAYNIENHYRGDTSGNTPANDFSNNKLLGSSVFKYNPFTGSPIYLNNQKYYLYPYDYTDNYRFTPITDFTLCMWIYFKTLDIKTTILFVPEKNINRSQIWLHYDPNKKHIAVVDTYPEITISTNNLITNNWYFIYITPSYFRIKNDFFDEISKPILTDKIDITDICDNQFTIGFNNLPQPYLAPFNSAIYFSDVYLFRELIDMEYLYNRTVNEMYDTFASKVTKPFNTFRSIYQKVPDISYIIITNGDGIIDNVSFIQNNILSSNDIHFTPNPQFYIDTYTYFTFAVYNSDSSSNYAKSIYTCLGYPEAYPDTYNVPAFEQFEIKLIASEGSFIDPSSSDSSNNYGYILDGSDYIKFNNDNTITEHIVINTRIYHTNYSSNWQDPIFKNASLYIYFEQYNNQYGTIVIADNQDNVQYFSSPIQYFYWYNIGIYINNNNSDFYINGVKDNSYNISLSSIPNLNNSLIGAKNINDSGNFTGMIADFYILNNVNNNINNIMNFIYSYQYNGHITINNNDTYNVLTNNQNLNFYNSKDTNLIFHVNNRVDSFGNKNETEYNTVITCDKSKTYLIQNMLLGELLDDCGVVINGFDITINKCSSINKNIVYFYSTVKGISHFIFWVVNTSGKKSNPALITLIVDRCFIENIKWPIPTRTRTCQNPYRQLTFKELQKKQKDAINPSVRYTLTKKEKYSYMNKKVFGCKN